MKRLTMEYGDKKVSLLPCRFCGSDPIIHSYRRLGIRYSIRCGNERGICRMLPRTTDYPELEQAAADWNMTPPEPNDPLTLEEQRQKRTEVALDIVRTERCRQETIWGDQSGNHSFEWMSILGEEYGELCEAVNETFFKNAAHPNRGGFEKIIKEATHVAAVAVAIIESAYRRKPEEGMKWQP